MPADSCTQTRRKLVTHSTLSLATGERSGDRQEWITEACAVPLFSDTERQRGTCRACADGWTHPHNYPVSDVQSFHAQARGLTAEDSAILARLASRGLNDWRAAESDTTDADLMAALARWRNSDRVAYQFERAFAGLHSSEIVANG